MANLSADRQKKALMPDTPAKIKKILESISVGIPYKIAAEANGLSEVHLYNLIRQGTADNQAGKDTEQARMVKALRAIEERDMAQALERIKHAEKGHRGAEWYLERRHWKYFGMNTAAVELQAQMDELKAQFGDKSNAKPAEEA